MTRRIAPPRLREARQTPSPWSRASSALAADPKASAARLAEFRRAQDEIDAGQVALARSQAAFAGERAAALAEIEAARLALAADRKAHAEQVVAHNRTVSAWRERSASIEEEAARWRRQFNIGIDLSNPDDMRKMAEGGYSRVGQLAEAEEAGALPEPPPEFEAISGDTEGAAFPAAVTLTRDRPRRGGRRVNP